jgi:sulfopyruvate decarboxylase subunit alpha
VDQTSKLEDRWVEAFRAARISVVATLPDSWLGPLLARLDETDGISVVRVAREPEIVGICAGAWLGGARPAGILGTAGLLACGHEFSTMNLAHQLPLFLVAARRGQVDDPLTYQVAQGLVGDAYLAALRIETVPVQTADAIATLPNAYERCLLVKRPLVFYAQKAALL